MFETVKKKFNHFQGKYTYRQRFLLFAVIYFMFIPPALYYVLHTINLFFESKKIEKYGIQYQTYAVSLLDAISQTALFHSPVMSSTKIYQPELSSLESKIEEDFKKLSNLNSHFLKFKGKDVGKFFSKDVDVDLTVEQWLEDWNTIQTISFDFPMAEYLSLIRNISKGIIANGVAFNLSGNSDLVNYILQRPLLFFFIPSEELMVEIILMMSKIKEDSTNGSLFNEQVAYNLSELRHQMTSVKQTIFQSTTYLIQNSTDSLDLFQQVRNSALTYFNLLEKFILQIDTAHHWENFNLLTIQIFKENENLRQLILKILQGRVNAQENYYRFLYWLNLFIFLSVAFLVLLFVSLKVITRHLSNLLEHTQKLSQGHFITCFCSRDDDEFGDVGKAFDIMSNSLKTVSLKLHDLSAKLFNATGEIFKATKEQEINVSNQEERIREIEITTLQISQGTRHLADTMQQLNVHILQESMADKAKESLDIMRTKIADLGEASKSIVGLLEKMEIKMQGMDNLIAFMTKVSENANLLSLNAAIETANVTHHKESFVAISQKIKRFANQTVLSTQNIKKILQIMTSNVSNVKSYSISCLKEISWGADELITFSSQLTKITRQGKDQLDQFKNFTLMMQTQANEIELMIKSITHLRENAQNNTATIQNVNTTLGKLSQTSSELQKILKFFEKVEQA
jgi:methyl-accepting chemotaxis protein WspA